MNTAIDRRQPNQPSRAWYRATVSEFLNAQADTIIGRLATNSTFADLPSQKDAWAGQIAILQEHLVGLGGSIFLEFNIPRMGRRIDTVLLIGPIVFVIEFKVGENRFERAAVEQVWDYALDLKNFHEASHQASILPLLIATRASTSAPLDLSADEDHVFRPVTIHPACIREAIHRALNTVTGEELDEHSWSTVSDRHIRAT